MLLLRVESIAPAQSIPVAASPHAALLVETMPLAQSIPVAASPHAAAAGAGGPAGAASRLPGASAVHLMLPA